MDLAALNAEQRQSIFRVRRGCLGACASDATADRPLVCNRKSSAT